MYFARERPVPIRMIGMVARFGTMRTKVLQELQIGDPTTTRNESAELAMQRIPRVRAGAELLGVFLSSA